MKIKHKSFNDQATQFIISRAILSFFFLINYSVTIRFIQKFIDGVRT